MKKRIFLMSFTILYFGFQTGLVFTQTKRINQVPASVNLPSESQFYSGRPEIAVNQNGDFAVTWDDGRNGIRTDVFVQFFDRDGSKVGENILVSDHSPRQLFDNQNSVIAYADSGNVIIVWEEFGSIYFRRYSIEGVPLSTRIKVNDDASRPLEFAKLSSDGKGDFAVIWLDFRNGYDVYAQLYTNYGTPVGENFRVNDDVNGAEQHTPSVAMDSSGAFVVSWVNSRTTDPNILDIYAQLYSSDGSPVGHNFRVSDDINAAENNPRERPVVGTEGGGDFVVIWNDHRLGGPDIFAQIYSSGMPLGNNFIVNDDASIISEMAYDVAFDQNQNIIVVWLDRRNMPLRAIYFRKYRSDGTLVDGSKILVSGKVHDPAICTSRNGEVVLTWHNTAEEMLYVQRFSASGEKLSDQIPVLDVGGSAPKIELSKLGIVFGYQKVPSSATQTLRITNSGTADLDVYDISTTNTVFTVTPTSGTIPPTGYLLAQIEFSPSEAGHIYSDSLVISSNDPEAGSVFVELSGTSIFLPSQIKVNLCTVAPDGSFFIGTNKGLFRSVDEGLSWDNIGFSGIGIDALAIHPDGTIFINAGPNRMYRSSDGGVNWTSLGVNGRPIAISPTGTVFRVEKDQMVYRSEDHGDTWILANQGLSQDFDTETDDIAFAPNGDIFINIVFLDIYRSSDNGATWMLADASGVPKYEWFTDILIRPNGDIFASALSRGVYKSIDNGDTWSLLDNGFGTEQITDLVQNSQGYLFAGTYAYAIGGVYRSEDDGESWTETNNGLANKDVLTLAVNPNDVIIAGTDGSGIFRSVDNGNTWQPANKGLAQEKLVINEFMAVNEINIADAAGDFDDWLEIFNSGEAVIPLGDIYLTNDRNIPEKFLLPDSTLSPGEFMLLWLDGEPAEGANHLPFTLDSEHGFLGLYRSGNIPQVLDSLSYGQQTADISFGRTQDGGETLDYLRYPTPGFSNTTPTAVSERESRPGPGSFLLKQNYPNPFNPSTRIDFAIARARMVDLSIYNLRGRKVATVVHGKKSPGSYSVEYNAAELASGIYFYRLKSGDFSQVKKFLFIK